jgi:hypothetical protein
LVHGRSYDNAKGCIPKCHVELAVTNGEKALWIQRVERNRVGTQLWVLNGFAMLVHDFRRTDGEGDYRHLS